MGLFSKPKCPRCGGVLTPTGYSWPFPALRCKNCIQNNKEKKDIEERISKLENQINNNNTSTT